MSDQLLPLYDQELAYLRQLAGEFADAHPKIAGGCACRPMRWTIRMWRG